MMANKFTKSVLERQAKEARLHPAATVVQPQTPPETTEPLPAQKSVSAPTNLPQTSQAPLEEPNSTEAVNAAALDLQALLASAAGRAARNKTFYLDQTVIDAIHRTAKAQKTTDSKLVNEILKKILGC